MTKLAIKLERWSNFSCDARDCDGLFFEAIRYQCFLTHVTIAATDALMWISPSLAIFFDVTVFHDSWLAFTVLLAMHCHCLHGFSSVFLVCKGIFMVFYVF